MKSSQRSTKLALIRQAWDAGWNTLEIARYLNLKEYEVYNLLDRARAGVPKNG